MKSSVKLLEKKLSSVPNVKELPGKTNEKLMRNYGVQNLLEERSKAKLVEAELLVIMACRCEVFERVV